MNKESGKQAPLTVIDFQMIIWSHLWLQFLQQVLRAASVYKLKLPQYEKKDEGHITEMQHMLTGNNL